MRGKGKENEPMDFLPNVGGKPLPRKVYVTKSPLDPRSTRSSWDLNEAIGSGPTVVATYELVSVDRYTIERQIVKTKIKRQNIKKI